MRSFFHFVTINASDRRTDGRTDGEILFSWFITELHSMQRGRNSKIVSTGVNLLQAPPGE